MIDSFFSRNCSGKLLWKLLFRIRRVFGVLLFLGGLFGAQVTICASGDTASYPWPEVTNEMRPWTRWWWMGSAVDQENLSHMLHQYAERGIGGVEITPIYGAKGFEDKSIEYLSPEWLDVLDGVVDEAHRLGLGVDLNNGTGWPFGGPQIGRDHSARKLDLRELEISAGETLRNLFPVTNNSGIGEITINDLIALQAVSEHGETIDLADRVSDDGVLNWSPKSGVWTVYAAFDGRTLQKVKRAAPGGEGLTFDHFSSEALNAYLKRFDEAFTEGYPDIRCFFNDSYEVFGADWTNRLFDEFEQRRGYDLRGFIPFLAGKGDPDTIARVKCDYRETLSDCLLEHFTKGWTEWAHQKGCRTRNQSHGSPANLLDLYTTVDIPEIETFGAGTFSIPGYRREEVLNHIVEPDSLVHKFAASGANITGKSLVSCEAFTWMGEHFRVSLAQCKPQMDQLFLSGINHLFFHGTTYSPSSVTWPGWLFYASTNFGPSNSFWAHLDGFNAYITKCQSILQTSRPTNDLLVYWPIYDIWQNPDGLVQQFSVHHSQEWLAMPEIRNLEQQGYSIDFVSDRILKELQVQNGEVSYSSRGPSYKALIVPECEVMPLDTFLKLEELARSGVPVVFFQWPKTVSGLENLDDRQQELQSHIRILSADSNGESAENHFLCVGEDLELILQQLSIPHEVIHKSGLRHHRRELNGNVYYFLVNHSGETVNESVSFRSSGDVVVLMDPMTGAYGSVPFVAEGEESHVRIQLQPGESCFVAFVNGEIDAPGSWRYFDAVESIQTIDESVCVNFLSGGPSLPEKMVLDRFAPWTGQACSSADKFSGMARYSTTFKVKRGNDAEYVLDLGEVFETAHIRINGKDAGLLWSIPYRLRVTDLIEEGDNFLDIEVTNLMANRIRDLDQREIPWRTFHDINFVNLKYQPFDAAHWDVMPSGIAGPVRLITYSSQSE